MTAPLAPPKRGRGPAVLAIVGGITLLAAVVAFAVGIVFLGTAARDLVEDAAEIRDDLAVEVEVPGEAEVTLAEGRYYVYAIGSGSSTTGATGGVSTTTAPGDPTTTAPGVSSTTVPGLPTTTAPTAVADPEVSVVGPGGGAVTLTEPGLEVVFNGISVDLYAIDQFTVSEPGSHTITAVTGASTVPRVGVGEVRSTDGVAERGIGGSILLVASPFLGGVGFLMLIGGIIWLAVRGSNRPPPPPPGPWGYGASSGYGAPPGYGGPPGYGSPPGYS